MWIQGFVCDTKLWFCVKGEGGPFSPPSRDTKPWLSQQGGDCPSPSSATQNHSFVSQSGGSRLLCHTADISDLLFRTQQTSRHVCCVTQQTCLLCDSYMLFFMWLCNHIYIHIYIYIYICRNKAMRRGGAYFPIDSLPLFSKWYLLLAKVAPR